MKLNTWNSDVIKIEKRLDELNLDDINITTPKYHIPTCFLTK